MELHSTGGPRSLPSRLPGLLQLEGNAFSSNEGFLAAPQEEIVSLPRAAGWVAEEQWQRLAMTKLCSTWFPVLFSPCGSKT